MVKTELIEPGLYNIVIGEFHIIILEIARRGYSFFGQHQIENLNSGCN